MKRVTQQRAHLTHVKQEDGSAVVKPLRKRSLAKQRIVPDMSVVDEDSPLSSFLAEAAPLNHTQVDAKLTHVADLTTSSSPYSFDVPSSASMAPFSSALISSSTLSTEPLFTDASFQTAAQPISPISDCTGVESASITTLVHESSHSMARHVSDSSFKSLLQDESRPSTPVPLRGDYRETVPVPLTPATMLSKSLQHVFKDGIGRKSGDEEMSVPDNYLTMPSLHLEPISFSPLPYLDMPHQHETNVDMPSEPPSMQFDNSLSHLDAYDYSICSSSSDDVLDLSDSDLDVKVECDLSSYNQSNRDILNPLDLSSYSSIDGEIISHSKLHELSASNPLAESPKRVHPIHPARRHSTSSAITKPVAQKATPKLSMQTRRHSVHHTVIARSAYMSATAIHSPIPSHSPATSPQTAPLPSSSTELPASTTASATTPPASNSTVLSSLLGTPRSKKRLRFPQMDTSQTLTPAQPADQTGHASAPPLPNPKRRHSQKYDISDFVTELTPPSRKRNMAIRSGDSLDDAPQHISALGPSSTVCHPVHRMVQGESYKVESILDVREQNGNLFYLCKWSTFSDKFNSWEPKTNLNQCAGLLRRFELERDSRERM